MILYLIAWFFFSHVIFTRYFTCFKRKNKLAHKNFINNQVLGSPWRILSSHRGGSMERAENTVAAFKHSVS